jgi:hypothetical protein
MQKLIAWTRYFGTFNKKAAIKILDTSSPFYWSYILWVMYNLYTVKLTWGNQSPAAAMWVQKGIASRALSPAILKFAVI